MGMTKPAWMLAATLLAPLALPAAQARALAPQHGAPARQTPAPDIRLDRAFMIGFWTDDDDCGNVIELLADGRFVAANGGGGSWTLAGDALTLTGTATVTVRIVPVDADTIPVVNQDGALGRSTRCPGRKGGAIADRDPA